MKKKPRYYNIRPYIVTAIVRFDPLEEYFMAEFTVPGSDAVVNEIIDTTPGIMNRILKRYVDGFVNKGKRARLVGYLKYNEFGAHVFFVNRIKLLDPSPNVHVQKGKEKK